MNWRFLTTIDPQVDIAFSRDLDSLIYQREKDAVEQFLESSKVSVVYTNSYQPIFNILFHGFSKKLIWNMYYLGISFYAGSQEPYRAYYGRHVGSQIVTIYTQKNEQIFH